MTSFALLEADPRYVIDSDGNVYGPKAGPLVTGLRRDGYPAVRVGRGGARAIHRLVAEAFVPNPHGKPDVAHGDGDRKNPVASNLRWVTRVENMTDQLRHGTRACGERQGHAKLSADDVRFIKAHKGAYRGVQVDLAEVFGVSKAAINDILRGKNWVTNLTENGG